MIRPLTWHKIPNQIYLGTVSNWHQGSIWWTAYGQVNYYAYVIRRGNDYHSVIATSVCPKMRMVNADDTDDILGDFTLEGSYNGRGVWTGWRSDNMFGDTLIGYVHKSLDQGMILIAQDELSGYNAHVGMAPNNEMTWWQVGQPLMSGDTTGHHDNGIALPKGMATKTYTIVPHWARWELAGRHYDPLTRTYYPQMGVYLPMDGATGTMSFGKKIISVDEQTEEQTISHVFAIDKADEHCLGQVPIWR